MSTKEELYDGSWVENQNVTDVTCVRCLSVYNIKTSTKKRLKKVSGYYIKEPHCDCGCRLYWSHLA